jgi:DNA-binding GntR family transcriptional regulator
MHQIEVNGMARPAKGAEARVLPLHSERPQGGQLHREPLPAQAVDRLRDMIVEGDLAPGARVIEAELCEQLGISRTPLREALKVLASEGLLELLPHRGARVTEVTARDVGELFEVIAALEGLAAEFAARRMSERDLERLCSMHERLERYHAARRRHDYFRVNHKIHHLIVALAGNGILTTTHARLLAQARRGRYLAILSNERWDEAMREHVDLMAALEACDAARAGAIWRSHTARTGEVVRAALETGKRSEGPRRLYEER